MHLFLSCCILYHLEFFEHVLEIPLFERKDRLKNSYMLKQHKYLWIFSDYDTWRNIVPICCVCGVEQQTQHLIRTSGLEFDSRHSQIFFKGPYKWVLRIGHITYLILQAFKPGSSRLALKNMPYDFILSSLQNGGDFNQSDSMMLSIQNFFSRSQAYPCFNHFVNWVLWNLYIERAFRLTGVQLAQLVERWPFMRTTRVRIPVRSNIFMVPPVHPAANG